MNKYDDIINLPHYELKNHKRMNMESRAAQFAPFAALTGYSDAVSETARLTSDERILDEDSNNILDEKLHIIEDNIKNKPIITIKYFVPDLKKNGGKYITYKGKVRRIDNVNKVIIFLDDKKVQLDRIVDILLEDK